MRTLIVAITALILAATPSFANNLTLAGLITQPAQSKPYTPAPTTKKQVSEQKTAQYYGGVCRNGLYYCYMMGYTGLVGTPCCGCGMCGWWSTY